MHTISKFANIIMHGYNVCELKRREEWLTVNGKYKKIEIYLFRCSAIPYSAFYKLPVTGDGGCLPVIVVLQ